MEDTRSFHFIPLISEKRGPVETIRAASEGGVGFCSFCHDFLLIVFRWHCGSVYVTMFRLSKGFKSTNTFSRFNKHTVFVKAPLVFCIASASPSNTGREEQSINLMLSTVSRVKIPLRKLSNAAN